MRRTAAGAKNAQDWDVADHDAAGHANVAPLVMLARSNMITSAANLETAAQALRALGQPVEAAQVLTMANTLMAIVDIMAKPLQRPTRVTSNKKGLTA